ncbi:MAG: xanthine dehydrogenase molybdopterin binding subunit [Microcystaceae cyanobacterium]
MKNAKTHESAEYHVTGKAIYTDDQEMPSTMLSIYPVLSAYAHAKIKKIDVTAVYDIEEVITIITAQDVTGINNTGTIIEDEILLPTDTVSYYGQPIVWIVAETELAAREGAKKVIIDYEPLEPILTIKDAIKAQSFQGDVQKVQRGNVTTALETSDYVIQGEVELGGQDHFYLETQTSWVIPDGEGHYKVYASTQHPTETQTMVAKVLGIANNQVVVTCLRMGGGFGGKETQANPSACAAALAAQKTGKSVRVRLRRHEDMLMTGKRHDFLTNYRLGFTKEGKITALKADVYARGGWSLDLSPPVMTRALFNLDHAYYMPNLEATGYIAKTNTVSNTAFRGFGGAQGIALIEDIIDRIARYLKLPADVIRQRNFYYGTGETNTTPYGQEIEGNHLEIVWQQVKENSGFEAKQQEIEQFNQENAYKKRGLALTPLKFGIAFTKKECNQAGALILIYLDGSIQLSHGGTEMGQGLHTKMLQVAARTLGLKIERFRPMPTSTDKVPNTSATAASSSADLNGQAVKNACDTIKERLRAVAAKLLGIDTSDPLLFQNERISAVKSPEKSISFDEVIQAAYVERISLSATGFYRTPRLHFDPKTNQGNPFNYYVFGACVSEVEVDRFTGAFKLLKVDIVYDAGESLNPLVDKGQIEGGFVQGMGWLTMEELIWNNQGKLGTFAPSTYKIPTISDIPEAFTVNFLENASQSGVIYGSKAVGEPPFMLGIAVREGIREAISAFGEVDLDYIPLPSPATPEAILKTIEWVDNQKANKDETVEPLLMVSK